MSNMIFNIQRFSVHDGPGIRTTVFFKGCTLRCAWCHNPESISFQRQLAFYPERCIGCGACFSVCPQKAHYTDDTGTHRIDRDACNLCMRCAEACYAEALTAIGSETALESLMESILSDALYYKNSGGGVTFSGGECMAQPGFLRDALAACKAHGIHTAVDTAGNVPWSSFEMILPYTDLFLYDLKAASSAVHERLTGAGNELILQNLRKLCDAGKQIFIRIPLIPGLNDGELAGMAELIKGLPVDRVEILPYHRLGEGKYASLGMEAATLRIDTPGDAAIQQAVDLFLAQGVHAVRT